MKNLKLITERFNSLLNSKLGNVRPLTEEYDEELYNELLDKYNQDGFEGMTDKEIEYIKSGGKSNYNDEDINVNKINVSDYKVENNPENSPKLKKFIYGVMDTYFSDMIVYESKKYPDRIFFIKKDFNVSGKLQPPSIAMVYNTKGKSLGLASIVEWAIVNSIKNLTSWDRDLRFSLVGEWFEEKYDYEIGSSSNLKDVGRLFYEFLDVEDEYNTQLLDNNDGGTPEIIQHINSLYNKYEKELNIKVNTLDDMPEYKIIMYVTDSPGAFMTYNYLNHLIFSKESHNFIKDIMNKYSVNLNSIKDSIGDWYEKRFNMPVSKVDLSNVKSLV
jgi:hypothetical protein